MKVYVDNKPESCEECPFLHDNYCLINWYKVYTADQVKQSKAWCPLQSLADYTKQVRKEVLGELMNMLGDRAELIDCGGVAEFMFTTYDLSMCVKEILGEEKGETECQKN